MARRKSRYLTLGYVLLMTLILIGAPTPADAQWDDTFVYDTKLAIKLVMNSVPITQAIESNPIPIDMDSPMQLYLQINNTHTETLNVSGTIWFYYQGIAIFPVQVRDPVSNTSWVAIPPSVNVTLPPIEAELDLGSILSFAVGDFDMNLLTGKFEASLVFSYAEMGSTDFTELSQHFYLTVETDALGAVTSVVGAAAVVSTVSAVYAAGNNFYSLFDGLQAARKIRSIQKKAGEIRSLPNLTVLGATPALFALFAGMTKMKRKETLLEGEEAPDAVSEYRLRQRIREMAPEAWPMDKCPQCKRDWHKKTNTCKKCKIDEPTAREAYADYLVTKVPKAIRALGKKKSLSIRKIAKKTKSSDYNAGVIGAAMVDIELVEIQKIETPIRGFALNIAGLAFLILTWQQLFGAAASQFQTTLTIVGGALSFAVIVALYFARRTQLKELEDEDAEALGIISGDSITPSEPSSPSAEDVHDTHKEERIVEDIDLVDETIDESPTDEEAPSDEAIDEAPADDFDEPTDEISEDLPEEEVSDFEEPSPGFDDEDVEEVDSTSDEDLESSEGKMRTPEELDKDRM